MFAWWGRTVFRYRYIVIRVMVALCLGGGVYGISLGQHVTQSGFYDEGSQSVHASVVADKTYSMLWGYAGDLQFDPRMRDGWYSDRYFVRTARTLA